MKRMVLLSMVVPFGLVGLTGCSDDSVTTDPCAEVKCASGQKCNPTTLKCEAISDGSTRDKTVSQDIAKQDMGTPDQQIDANAGDGKVGDGKAGDTTIGDIMLYDTPTPDSMIADIARDALLDTFIPDAPSECSNQTKDGLETDVDCGGGVCPACADTKICTSGADCQSKVCDSTALTCSAPSCSDQTKNGLETDTDCGGGVCPACADTKTCASGTDCQSKVCDSTALTCSAPSCSDQTQNGLETDTDCGGGVCPACADTKTCASSTDCQSKVCDSMALTCSVPTCSDQTKNGLETDTDCGGGLCPACASSKGCAQGSDCTSKVCTPATNTCAVPTCSDQVQNGNETDVDCGSTCPKCAIGKSCSTSTDCLESVCASTKCRAALNCLELHVAQPALTDGAYSLDPDGSGGNASFTAYCNMTTDGGGWTRVAGIAADNTHVDANAVNPSGLTTSSAAGKFSDAVINSLKAGASPAFRLRCRAKVGYFQTGCTFNATADASGACTAQSYAYPPTSYGTGQYLQTCITGLADGDNDTNDRLIYGANNCGGLGCDTDTEGWGGTGELWVR